MQAKQLRAWRSEFEHVNERIADCFGRREPRDRARAYLQGLLEPLERKNGWQLAEAAGDRRPDGVQDFLARSRWDADVVRDDLRRYVIEHLGEPDAVLVLDETGFVKKGEHSAASNASIPGRPGASRTVRLACSWPMPAAAATPSSTANSTCPKNVSDRRTHLSCPEGVSEDSVHHQ